MTLASHRGNYVASQRNNRSSPSRNGAICAGPGKAGARRGTLMSSRASLCLFLSLSFYFMGWFPSCLVPGALGYDAVRP